MAIEHRLSSGPSAQSCGRNREEDDQVLAQNELLTHQGKGIPRQITDRSLWKIQIVFFENRGGSKQSDREKPGRFFWEEGFELDFEDRLGWPSIERLGREGHSRQNSVGKAWRWVRAGQVLKQ